MIDNKRDKALKHVKEFFTCELIPCRFPYKSCQRSTEERRKILSQPAYIRKKIYARQEAERERERQVSQYSAHWDIATLDIAAALPIATSTPVTNLCQHINSDFGYNDLKF